MGASPLREPLLARNSFASPSRQSVASYGDPGGGLWRLGKDFWRQLGLAAPLAVNLVAANAGSILNLMFVGRGGTVQLAAAAAGNNVAVMLGRLVLLGLCGAVDTLAAQAWGAGKHTRLPLLLQRAVLFLWAHCVLISAAMMAMPYGLLMLGQDPTLSYMVQRYLLALLPSVWLEAVSRPITRVLVARGVAAPQMAIALIGLPINVATNYLLVIRAGWEYIGAAAATSVSAGVDLALLLAYVAISKQWGGVIGRPSWRALHGWRHLARLAYPAASMKCAESWAFTIMTLAATLLPNACTATAAVGISYNVYGVLFIAFVACSTAACVTVGNRLGAGDPRGAKFAAAASVLVVPVAWGAAAAALIPARCQSAIIGLFVTPTSGSSDPSGDPGSDPEVLIAVMRQMFVIVAGLVLVDGIQTILSGVIQGCGRQASGAIVNFVAFYVFAVPLALGLAFSFTLPAWLPALGGQPVGLGMGPQGLYLGMAAGPVIQTVCYALILWRTNWQRASEKAVYAASLATPQISTADIPSLMRRYDPGALAGPGLVRATSLGASPGSGALPPWLLPMIEERSGEGRDSSDGSLYQTHQQAGSGSGPGSGHGSASNLAAAPFRRGGSGLGRGLNGSAHGGLNGNGAGNGYGEDQIWASGSIANGGSDAAAMGASPTRVSVVASSGSAAALAAAAAAAMAADVSPAAAARSQVLILEHGSPPTVPPHHCPLAATLDPGSCASVSVFGAGLGNGSDGVGPSPAGGSPSSGHHVTAPPGMPPPSLVSAAALAVGPHGGGGGLTGPMAVPKEGDGGSGEAAGARKDSRWTWFSWGKGQVGSVTAAAGSAAVVVPGGGKGLAGVVAPAMGSPTPGGAAAPLQLPGVIVAAAGATPPAAASPIAPPIVSAGSGGGGGAGPAAAAALAAAELPLKASPGSDDEEDARTASSGSSYSGGGAGGGGGAGQAARGCGEVYRSLEHLANAAPGSGDYFAFSAGSVQGSWLDGGSGILDATPPGARGASPLARPAAPRPCPAAPFVPGSSSGNSAPAVPTAVAVRGNLGGFSSMVRAVLLGGGSSSASASAAPPPPAPALPSLPVLPTSPPHPAPGPNASTAAAVVAGTGTGNGFVASAFGGAAGDEDGATVAGNAGAIGAAAADSDGDTEFFDARTHRSSGSLSSVSMARGDSSGIDDLAS
ncbi:hypothetical protein HYH03_006381 [Edaphochlamys debaryana]|uniref:Protein DETOXIFICATION n=1 Tax=Edaphochlamys debaryana TaxID=47281 RepID=A0A835Y5C9_9CHLO|nr:hypothetical protein HYH03_006381 [Edaphochlamys debaryana]|eukprot:KAG2495434.1 hypothetical protein HYH03_006381 [Edaphochlamys debaryana]